MTRNELFMFDPSKPLWLRRLAKALARCPDCGRPFGGLFKPLDYNRYRVFDHHTREEVESGKAEYMCETLVVCRRCYETRRVP